MDLAAAAARRVIEIQICGLLIVEQTLWDLPFSLIF
jgi:hypothetical protein